MVDSIASFGTVYDSARLEALIIRANFSINGDFKPCMIDGLGLICIS